MIALVAVLQTFARSRIPALCRSETKSPALLVMANVARFV